MVQLHLLRQQIIKEHGVKNEDTAIITSSELKGIKNLISSTSVGKVKAADLETDKEKLRQMELAAERKERIRQIDWERTKRGADNTNPEDAEAAAKNRKRVLMAKRQLDENMDEVKHMNKIMHYARCVTIRDAQINEKEQMEGDRKEEQRRLDMMMEMERLKAISMYEDRERKRIDDRRKGAAVIRAQMEEREHERLRQLELKQQEQEAMLRHIDKMKADDRREAERKRDASRRLMEDVALANAEQIRLKTRQRETELEEERRITEYLRERERREQDLADEQERTRLEKERETARLRSLQEKAQDKQAELDSLRAKRAQEQYEREWRQKEKEEAERVWRINKDLAQARDTQKREKEAMLAEQAMIEQEEFERVIAVQRAEDEIERQKRSLEHNKRMGHANDLKSQINMMEEKKRKERREFIEEGNKLRKQREEDEEHLAIIRDEKLQQLEESGVPGRYKNELLRRRAQQSIFPSK